MLVYCNSSTNKDSQIIHLQLFFSIVTIVFTFFCQQNFAKSVDKLTWHVYNTTMTSFVVKKINDLHKEMSVYE